MARVARRRRPPGSLCPPTRSGGGCRLSDFLTEPDAAIELELPPQDVPRLWRAPLLTGRRAGRSRSTRAGHIWHDTADGALAADGVSLGCDRDVWRVERLRPRKPLEWLPARRAPLLAQAPGLEALGWKLPDQLAPVAAFEGRRRTVALEAAATPTRVSVLEGTLRGVAHDRPACRLILEGDLPTIVALAHALGDSLPLTVPRAGLAAQAMAVASGRAAQPRRTGAPSILPGTSLDDAITGVTAHLADVILHWAAQVADDRTPEPVHQMRVGVRRLRSALTAFGRAMGAAGDAPWLAQFAGRLKNLAMLLGAARDWDVFLTETGADVENAFPGDRRVAGLLAAAARRRAAAYADLQSLINAREWPAFELGLALLPTTRPWSDDASVASEKELAEPVRDYAERALDRRLKHVLALGDNVASLPDDTLHDLRKQVKKLRYATEFFARLFPEKIVGKYLSRLERLQAVLGAVNDRAVAAGLMRQLGGGSDRAYACGVVLGFGAGRAAALDGSVAQSWEKFARAAPFWD